MRLMGMGQDAEIKSLKRQLDEANAALAALRESETLYRTTYDSSDEGFMVVDVVQDPDGQVVDWRYITLNPAVERITGMKDLAGRLVSEVMPDLEREWAERYSHVVNTGEAIRFELPASGLGLWFNVFLARIGPASSRRVMVVFTDVTERKRSDLALRESEARHSFLLEFSDALRPLADSAEIQFVAASLLAKRFQASRAFYIEVESDGDAFVIRRDYADGVPSIAGRLALSQFDPFVAEEWRGGRTIVSPDVESGRSILPDQLAAYRAIKVRAWLGVPLFKGGRLIAALGINHSEPRIWNEAEIRLVEEATERTWAAVERARAEAELRASEAEVAGVLEGMSEGFILLDRQFHIARINAEGLRIDGRPASELVGKTHWEVWPGSENAPQGMLYKRLMSERASGALEIEYDWPDRKGWFETRVDPVNDGLAVFFRDVSERKAAEAAVREAEERLRLATDNAEIGFWDVDLVNNVLIWPPRTKAMFGISPGVPVSMDDFYAGLHPDDREATSSAFQGAADPERQALYDVEYRTIGKEDGAVRWVAAKGRGVFDEAGRCLRVTGTAINVTERKLTEAALRASEAGLRESEERRGLLEKLALAQDALRQAQKMEAMGQLTGGVAHDFNNLLTPIIGSLDMLIRRGVGSERERRLIDGAMQSAERAKTLVQRLLAFARRQPLQPVAIDVTRLVDGIVGLLGSTLGPTIDIRVNMDGDLPPAKADPNQLEMALLNLSVNARDAMPDGGTLSVTGDRQDVGGGHEFGLKPGPYVRLTIADTGVGMDAVTRERAIEPFFSTKGVGKGTGLGLSMAHGLAAQLGGALTIDSAPGKGTAVTLWLPVSAEPAGTAETNAPVPSLRPGRGLALLVDDEDLVRMSTADMLIDLGFEVVEAASAEAALQLMVEGTAPDLLVTDHLMPGLSGVELAREARRLNPALPVLVVSGYAELEGLAPDLARLTKPFRNAELAASLASLLGVSDPRDRR